jgi:8-oxo-dGTP pyrophosphatase MutT (NUDIX family)
MIDLFVARSYFHNVLPKERLGRQHCSLDEFRRHVDRSQQQLPVQQSTSVTADSGVTTSWSTKSIVETTFDSTKEYTLIIVTEYGTKRILLGKKHRGFGKGMYNSFGGKIEPNERNFIPRSAIRELYEETGIDVQSEANMAHCRVGTLHFTFEDSALEMIVHLFRIYIRFDDEPDCDTNADDQNTEMNGDHDLVFNVSSRSIIRPCDEITPIWFDDYFDIPLDNMFADDSIWLTYLLFTGPRPRDNQLQAWFHFQQGGQETNTILHYYMEDIEPLTQTSLN